LEPLLETAKGGDWKKVEEMSARVAEFETLADGLHRDTVSAISQGVFFSGSREDSLELMEENDSSDLDIVGS
jgi:uncharacterized protein Yka (UPF0111/DUF47 family)